MFFLFFCFCRFNFGFWGLYWECQFLSGCYVLFLFGMEECVVSCFGVGCGGFNGVWRGKFVFFGFWLVVRFGISWAILWKESCTISASFSAIEISPIAIVGSAVQQEGETLNAGKMVVRSSHTRSSAKLKS